MEDQSTTETQEQQPPKQEVDKKTIISFKVSEKGAVSVYGLGRFPVTLYQEQWKRLLAQSENILTFIEENKDRLKVKTD